MFYRKGWKYEDSCCAITVNRLESHLWRQINSNNYWQMFRRDSRRTGYMQHYKTLSSMQPCSHQEGCFSHHFQNNENCLRDYQKTALTIKLLKEGLPPKQIDKKWATEMTCFTEAHKSRNSHYFCSDENKSKTSALSNFFVMLWTRALKKTDTKITGQKGIKRGMLKTKSEQFLFRFFRCLSHFANSPLCKCCWEYWHCLYFSSLFIQSFFTVNKLHYKVPLCLSFTLQAEHTHKTMQLLELTVVFKWRLAGCTLLSKIKRLHLRGVQVNAALNQSIDPHKLAEHQG